MELNQEQLIRDAFRAGYEGLGDDTRADLPRKHVAVEAAFTVFHKWAKDFKVNGQPVTSHERWMVEGPIIARSDIVASAMHHARS